MFNPAARALAGIAPWWVVLETKGRKSGRPRQAPLARGPVDGNIAWLITVHGERSAFAYARSGPRAIGIEPKLVRVKLDGAP